MSLSNVRPPPFPSVLLAVILAGLFLAGAGIGRTEEAIEPTREQLSRLSEDIQKAGRELRYQAEQTVYEYLGDRIHVTRYRIQHAFPFLRKEIISGPEGARVVMLQDGVSLWSYFPDRGMVVKEAVGPSDPILPVELPKNLDLIARNYRVVIRGPVIVDDGLECQVVEFVPRKADRPSRELWLEVERKLPVRMYMDFPDGRPAYRTELKQIRWDPGFGPDTFQIKVPRDTRVFEIQKWANLSLEEAGRLLNRRVTLPRFVPDGYVFSDIVLRMEPPKKRLQVIYSDGLSSYSVFQEWTGPSVSGSDALPAPVPVEVSMAAPGPREPEEEPAEHGPLASGADAAPNIYRYGLITVVTRDHGGRRTVGVGDIHESVLLDVVRSVAGAD